MTLRTGLPIVLGVAVLAGSVALSAGPALRAFRDRHAQRQAHAHVLALCTEYQTLSSDQAGTWTIRRPQTQLVEHLSNALAAAGCAASDLQHVTPQGDTTLRASPGEGRVRIMRQSARCSVAMRDLASLGRFLSAWRTMQTRWVPSEIRIVPAQSAGSSGEGSGLMVDMLLETTYFAEGAR
jgi:hypothetical protein